MATGSASKLLPTLAKLAIRKSEYVLDADSNREVFHVYDPHALVQTVGYIKYLAGRSSPSELVFLRGQSKNYPTLSPSLFRGLVKQANQMKRVLQLKEELQKFCRESKVLGSLAEDVVEPLVQHYGFRTTWIDLVDNVWIALWFACHTAISTGPDSKHIHYERRSPARSTTSYAYILLVAVDAVSAKASPSSGYIRGDETEFVDLRIACPSTFLRPHAQHGVLFRLRNNKPRWPTDYSSQIRGVVRVDLQDALAWLGSGSMLGVHALFPPPYYDNGYQLLLKSSHLGTRTLGSIGYVAA